MLLTLLISLLLLALAALAVVLFGLSGTMRWSICFVLFGLYFLSFYYFLALGLLLFICVLAVTLSSSSDKIPEFGQRSLLGTLNSNFAGLFSLKRRELFLRCAFSMLAKLARAHGRVSEQEVELIDRYIDKELGLNNAQRHRVISIFKEAKDSPRTFHSYASEFYQAFSHQPEMLGHMIDLLFQIAAADGKISAAEDELIRAAALLFGLRDSFYGLLREKYIRQAREQVWQEHAAQSERAEQEQPNRERPWAQATHGPNKYYVLLNCTKESSDQEIKKQYRKLALKHHPDRVLARGLPPELVKLANRKFQEIQEAYEKVCEARGMK
jgi:DnaJ like chaperone protein